MRRGENRGGKNGCLSPVNPVNQELRAAIVGGTGGVVAGQLENRGLLGPSE